MPAHAHARGPTRPNKPPRQPPLSGVPGAHKLPTGNGPPAQSRCRRVTARQRNHTQPHTRGTICNLPVPAWHGAESRMRLVHSNHRPVIGARVGSRQVQVIPRWGAKIHNGGPPPSAIWTRGSGSPSPSHTLSGPSLRVRSSGKSRVSTALTKFPYGAQRFFNGRPVGPNLQLNAKPLGSVEA